MHPVVSLWFGDVGFHVTAYRLFMILGVAATLLVSYLVATRRGLPRRGVVVCLVSVGVSFPVGARLFDAATKRDLYLKTPERLWSTDLAGFSMFGGLILAVVVGVTVCRWTGLPLPRMADSAMPGMGVGVALMRVGCFMAGCCYGRTTELPWGVVFPTGSNAHLRELFSGGLSFGRTTPHAVHPTQLYEALAAMIAVALCAWIFRRGTRDGTTFLVCAAWYGGFRLLNHFLRVPGAELSVSDWFYPSLYIAVTTIAVVGLVARNRREKAARPVWSRDQ